jgi:Glycosyltransferase Family 4
VRVGFDSRPSAQATGLGRYAGCLLEALRDTASDGDEIFETHRPRRADLFHAPWMGGAMLHCPSPMVVTLHDLTAVKRPSERLRCGGIHMPLRRLAVQRATHVIVPDEAVAREAVVELGLERERIVVIPRPSDAAASAALDADAAPHSAGAAPEWTWEDAARETWRLYRRALAHPGRPCVTVRRRPAVLAARRASRAPIQ